MAWHDRISQVEMRRWEKEEEEEKKEEKEKSDEPEPNFEMLSNPARVMKAQLKVISLEDGKSDHTWPDNISTISTAGKYRPMKDLSIGGVIMLDRSTEIGVDEKEEVGIGGSKDYHWLTVFLFKDRGANPGQQRRCQLRRQRGGACASRAVWVQGGLRVLVFMEFVMNVNSNYT